MHVTTLRGYKRIGNSTEGPLKGCSAIEDTSSFFYLTTEPTSRHKNTTKKKITTLPIEDHVASTSNEVDSSKMVDAPLEQPG